MEGTVTDHSQNPDDPISNPLDPDGHDHIEDDDEDSVEVVFISRPTQPTPDARRDPYDFGGLFACWSWEAGYRNWNDGVRALVRALRGLEEIGLIERRTIRCVGRELTMASF